MEHMGFRKSEGETISLSGTYEVSAEKTCVP